MDMLEAKTELSQLVDAAERGEEVVIARDGVPVARMVKFARPKMNLGFLEGQIKPIPDSLLFAMTDEEADRFIDGEA